MSVLMLYADTSNPDGYFKTQLNRRTIWNYATGTLTPSKGPDTMLNQIMLSISTVEKCAPMQVVKQPEHGRVWIIALHFTNCEVNSSYCNCKVVNNHAKNVKSFFSQVKFNSSTLDFSTLHPSYIHILLIHFILFS